MTDTTPSRPTPGDALRFAFGTLTALPVRLTRWDRAAARGGMLAAPLAGLVVGGCAAAAGSALLLLGAGPVLAAVASVAAGAVLTRALHLDGLADVADGLGSAKPAEDALRIMKRSDIGPFGVVTLLLVLLGQVAALAGAYADDTARGAAAVAVAALAARCSLTLASRAGVPPARPEGLGAAVAGVLPAWSALLVAALATAAAAALGAATGPYGAVRAALAVPLALAAGELLLRHCVRRFGGVTGDVFGALAETSATTALVVLALG
ncbi:adenosylcobinamide-GDP ribazoletransferase [Streptomyces albireticuli]|uniref:Adenosylcobinamide-GDP ribazoletransferase n=1 Tax=Streptomyces albireticuli TaxID=1940 RepID=A0A2A2DFD7_9ACTN|nr:adenosylcobinamide-GDP ribazoletransferase [Streptomyces albireticuli]MCD9142067.1 adenosylcobinamide-GDP ribazoletransferase [Streptomyces albireticuli]MCD9162679.1 adenosylcobinamide-GDP ribazoletransferase [Streptomyces albireticuli]MCD9190241.1 adenosylcobinamide-GDP ribazoletransferase [Streptomyces albireticuli]PAU50157.1 adenosylcobinamide-GDP ribazoletransferase [Streptomyces albireticuli]